jgi:hypothetical protein
MGGVCCRIHRMQAVAVPRFTNEIMLTALTHIPYVIRIRRIQERNESVNFFPFLITFKMYSRIIIESDMEIFHLDAV